MTWSMKPRSPNEPSRPCRHEPRGCDLNSVNEIEITPHEAVSSGEGNRLLPSRGRGEGVRPRALPPAPGNLETLWSYQRTLLRLAP